MHKTRVTRLRRLEAFLNRRRTFISVEELAESFDVSVPAMYKDLEYLRARGVTRPEW